MRKSADAARDRATKIAARPSLSKLVSDGHLSFEELGIIRDEIAAAIHEDRAEPVSAGEVDAAANAISISFHEEGYIEGVSDSSLWNEFMKAGRAALEAARNARAGRMSTLDAGIATMNLTTELQRARSIISEQEKRIAELEEQLRNAEKCISARVDAVTVLQTIADCEDINLARVLAREQLRKTTYPT